MPSRVYSTWHPPFSGVIYTLRSIMSGMGYTLYRYIVTGQYAAAPVNYFRLLLPAVGVGIVGMTLCIFYFVHKRKH